MPVDPQTTLDLLHLLDATRATGTPHDELVLLRASLRRYLATGDAAGSVAWAAAELSAALTRTPNRPA